MKKILVVGATTEGNDAVSGIMNCIIKHSASEYEYYLFGYNSDLITQIEKTNIVDLKIKDPFYNITFCSCFYRPLRKLFYLNSIDDYKLSSFYAEVELEKKCKGINFDLVIGVSGKYCFSVAAYNFAKRHGVKLKLVYFDPFINNVYARSKKRRSQEMIWLKYADQIYYNMENLVPDTSCYSYKWKGFKIPIEKKEPLVKATQDFFIYGGSFYKGIREPGSLVEFAKKLNNTKYSIKCYSNWKKESEHEKLTFYPMVDRKKFENICESAKALIYIGNLGGNSKSSKYLEYIALKKPIIGINVEKDNEVRKYPFYYDWNDDDLIKKISFISDNELADFDVYSIYKDRNPFEFAADLFR